MSLGAVGKRRMRFNAVYLELHGQPRMIEPKPDLDIADLFSERARRLGFEAPINTFGGLWSTHCDYDAHSLLEGTFSKRAAARPRVQRDLSGANMPDTHVPARFPDRGG